MTKITKEEAIFCEKSYMGETDCVDCKYYATDTCKSREIHKMAIKALEQYCEDMGEVSDGYHTFNQLYYQRAVLFACIVKYNKNKAWKSFKHSDGKYCFDSNGEWFIVGIDTPQGSYTYHYAKEYWDMFDCQELECGKEWDGHTEEDVTRLLSLEQETSEDCNREAMIDLVARGVYGLPPVIPSRPKGRWIKTYEPNDAEPFILWKCSRCGLSERRKTSFCPNCGADMRESGDCVDCTLDKIRAEIMQVADQEKVHDKKWALGLRYAVKIIDKYKESGE